MALTNNLLAFYKLDNTNDSSGNNRTLTNNGNVSFASGKIGNAAVFDGSNYLSQPSVSVAGGSFTVSQWLKVNSDQSGVFSETVSKWAGGSAQGPFVTGLNEGGQPDSFFAYCRTDSEQFPMYVSTNYDEWVQFVVVVNSGQNMQVYKNGILADTISITGDVISDEGSSEFQIGAGESNGSFPLNGQIDAVGIWNRALNSEEVAELYNNGTGLELEVTLETGLQAFYKLSDTSDSSGNNRTLTNNGNVSFASGKLGNAAVFDGSNWLTNNLGSFSQLSFSAFAKIPIATMPEEENGVIVANWGSNSNSLIIARANDGSVFGAAFDQFFSLTNNQPISDEQFPYIHSAGTYDGAKFKLYFNGSLATEIDGSGDIDLSQFTIGSQSNGAANKSIGQIDAVGIWNRALSDAEVAALYNNGTGLELPAGPAGNLANIQGNAKFFGNVKFVG